MRLARFLLPSLLVTLSASTAAAQTVIDFESVAPCAGNSIGVIGGVDFGSAWLCYAQVQPPYTPKSGIARAYSETAATSFSFLTPTTFDGAWFAGPSMTSITFALYLGGTEVATSATTFLNETPVWLAAGYAGAVDRVEVRTNLAQFYVMDDVTFGGTSVVPEPSTWALLGTGLAGVLGVAARRKRA